MEDTEEAESNTQQKEAINPPRNEKSATVRPPPIHVTETTFAAVSQIIKDLPDLKNQFTFKKKSVDEFTFHSKTMTAFYKLKDKLTLKKYKYFTYTPKHLKNKNIVLKGICEEYSKTQTNHWSHVYKSIDYKKPQSFFPQIKRLFRPQNSPAINFLTINQQNAHLCPRINMPSSDADTVQHIYEPKSILNFIGTYYETINSPRFRFTNQNTPLKKEVDAHIHALMTEFENDTLENTSITTFSDNNPAHSPTTPANNFLFSDFRTTYSNFKSLPNKTSTGLDNIPPIVLKHLPLKIIDDYNKIFNNCINNRYFPTAWKKAKILPIIKKNKPPNLPTSYRPISLTPAISKVFEAILHNSIANFTYAHEIIPHNQFGFNTNTLQYTPFIDFHTLLTRTCIKRAGRCLSYRFGEGLRLSFGTRALLYTIIKNNYPRDLIRIIWSMLSNRDFVIWNGSITSDFTFNITEGLMQGTVNSPILFNIFTHGVCNLAGLNQGDGTYSLAFADDYVLLVADKDPQIIERKIQHLATEINKYYTNWNLKINPDKCELIIFHRPLNQIAAQKRTAIKNINITMKQNNIEHKIPRKKIVKYLGVHFDYLPSQNAQSYRHPIEKSPNRIQSAIEPLFNKYLNHKAKIICYLLLIRPIITYASPIWWNCSASTMEKIRKFERVCLRSSLHMYRRYDSVNKPYFSTNALYNRAGIPRIDNHIIKLTRDYMANLASINNNYMSEFASFVRSSAINTAATGYISPHSFIRVRPRLYIHYRLQRSSRYKSLVAAISNPSRFLYMLYALGSISRARQRLLPGPRAETHVGLNKIRTNLTDLESLLLTSC
ncbi:unnamed protein product [Trichogramma brassicae]|uniref:Reverse transcriptase domain-containing protein n=1 Tax=Trichogramma brassicae TaxID=86971 RepID=A0A6H5IRX0_9HYME|nr:unnamed protein product [Trichogramma brassicae]